MNLKEFLSHKKNCPICDSELELLFHSKRKQKIIQTNDTLEVIFSVNNFNKLNKVTYKVGYVFDINNNSFHIDFYSQNDIKYDCGISKNILNQFKELNSNLKFYKFYKHCKKCKQYLYSSNVFPIDLKNPIIDIRLDTEFFGIYEKIENGYNVFRLLNFIQEKNSQLFYGNYKDNLYAKYDEHNYKYDANFLKLPLIKFNSSNQIKEKLNNITLLC